VSELDLSDNPGISESEAAARISAKFRTEPSRAPDGRFQSANPPKEPETPDPKPESDPGAPDPVRDEEPLGEDDIVIDDGDEVEPTQAASLEMPASYGAPALEVWNSFTPEQQKFLHQHDSKRTSGLSRQANELKTAQEQVKAQAQAIEQERLQLANAAQRFQSEAQKRFQAKFGDVKDVQSLAATDKGRFIEYQAAVMELQVAAQEAQAWTQQIENDRIKQLTEFRQAENAKLAERYGLDDEAKASAFQERIVKFVEPLGISLQRLSQYTAEEIALADDGRKWRAAMAKRQQVEKQKAPPPKVIKSGAPQTPSNSASQSVQQAKSQLKNTGRLEDAAKLFALKFKSGR